MQIRFKKLHPDAITPTKATDGSAGFDLYADHVAFVVSENNKINLSLEKITTGIAIEIPKGYVGLLIPRSSLYKKCEGEARLTNSIGVIDSDYRGELTFVYNQSHLDQFIYNKGERCGQLIIVPCPEIELIECDELSETTRGTGGFGSTGI